MATDAKSDSDGCHLCHHKHNFNTLWKNLDVTFKSMLAKHIKNDNKDKFETFAKQCGFSDIQTELLFETIEPHLHWFKFDHPQPAALVENDNSANSNNNRKRNKRNEAMLEIDEAHERPRRKRRKIDLTNTDQENDSTSDNREALNDSDESTLFVVEHIVNHRTGEDGDNQFLIKWKRHAQPTWEPPAHLPPICVEEYLHDKGLMMDKHGTIKLLKKKKEKIKSKPIDKKGPSHSTETDDDAPINDGKHKCNVCGIECKSGQALGGHMSKHRSPKKDRVRVQSPRKCKLCGAEFRSGQALGGHMSRKHPSPKKDTLATQSNVSSLSDTESPIDDA